MPRRLELFVYPPAFGLPSIDPECHGAICLLTLFIKTTDWDLRAHYSPSQASSQLGLKCISFPCLNAGVAVICGYSAIWQFLCQTCNFPAKMTEESYSERADSTAIMSLIDHEIRMICDLYAYATTKNYDQTMRPAIAQSLMPSPISHIHSFSARSSAIERAGGLDLGFLMNGRVSTPVTDQAKLEASKVRLRFRPGSKLNPAFQYSFQRDRLSAIAAPPLISLAQFTSLSAKPGSKEKPKLTGTTVKAYAYLSFIIALSPVPDPWLLNELKENTPGLLVATATIQKLIFPSSLSERLLPWFPLNPFSQSPTPTATTGSRSSGQVTRLGQCANLASSYVAQPASRLFSQIGFRLEYIYQSLTPSLDIILPETKDRNPTSDSDRKTIAILQPLSPRQMAWSWLVSPTVGIFVFSAGVIAAHHLLDKRTPQYLAFRRW